MIGAEHKEKAKELVSFYSRDWEGNLYFFDLKDKEWLIHDGKSILYSVKCPELIQYLEENKFNKP